MQRTFFFRNLGCPLAKGSSDFTGSSPLSLSLSLAHSLSLSLSL
jgi:hypothetical protein